MTRNPPEAAVLLRRLQAAYGPAHGWWPVDEEWHNRNGTDPRFEVCVGAILTQNTAWRNVEAALAKLRDANLLAPHAIRDVHPSTLRAAIRPTGHYNQKARYLRTFARAVCAHPTGLDAFLKGPLPVLRARLLAVTGIGEETADDILVYAARRPSFIIDAYTRRLTARTGLGAGTEPYADLQGLWSRGLPRSARAHGQAHALVVQHAKATCTARRPACDTCVLRDLCPRRGIGR